MNLPLLEATEYQPVATRPGPAGRRVYIETYGCQMNVADSELVASILADSGFQITERAEQADIILLNTCAVREHAEERVIGRVSQLNGLRAHRPNLTLGILGCMAQHLSKTLPDRAPFVDLVMGPDSYSRLPQLLAQSSDDALLDVRLDRSENYSGVHPQRTTGTNAWVTIIRGCDKFCTFCIVPFVRGRERSVPADEIVRQVQCIAAEGFKEVTLLGQTVNSYCAGNVDFADLLRQVSQVEGIERVRFTSPYPVDFTDRVIDAMAEVGPVCPSLHLPVQSGSDEQLARMKRGYTVDQYRQLVHKLRAALPDLGPDDRHHHRLLRRDRRRLPPDLRSNGRDPLRLGFHVQIFGTRRHVRPQEAARRRPRIRQGRAPPAHHRPARRDLARNQPRAGRPHGRSPRRRPVQAASPRWPAPLLRPQPAGQDGDFLAISSEQRTRSRSRRPHHLAHALWRPHRRRVI